MGERLAMAAFALSGSCMGAALAVSLGGASWWSVPLMAAGMWLLAYGSHAWSGGAR